MLNWNDHFDNDREAGTEETPQAAVKDLIVELENIYMLLEDDKTDEAWDELECQCGTIGTIMGSLR